MNLYSYCFNSPTLFTDPFGLKIVLGKGTTEEMRNHYEQAISHIKQYSPSGKKLIECLESDKTPTITIYMNYKYEDDMYNPDNRNIYWNPTGALLIGSKSTGGIRGVMSPAVALAHELGHVNQHNKGDLDDYLKKKESREKMENRNLAETEFQVAVESGEPYRHFYGDHSGMVRTEGPTSRKVIGSIR